MHSTGYSSHIQSKVVTSYPYSAPISPTQLKPSPGPSPSPSPHKDTSDTTESTPSQPQQQPLQQANGKPCKYGLRQNRRRPSAKEVKDLVMYVYSPLTWHLSGVHRIAVCKQWCVCARACVCACMCACMCASMHACMHVCTAYGLDQLSVPCCGENDQEVSITACPLQ